MLHDFVFLESQTPNPTCRHLDRCSLSLYLDGCASCELSNSGDQCSEPVSLATAEHWPTAPQANRRGRAPRASSWNG
jgi:hypothetical protein